MDTLHQNEMDKAPDDGAPDGAPAELVGVVQFGKRSYVTSLIWNSAGDQKTLVSEARESAERVGAPVVCLYRVGADALPQYGLGDALIGHKPGLPSLAAAVAAASGGAMYGVWRSDDGVWVLLGVRSDASIVYDKAFENEAAARVEFYEGLTTEPWTEIICPQGWQIEGTQPSDSLGERFTSARVKLRNVRGNVRRMIILAVLGASLVGGGAYLYKQFHKAPPKFTQLAPVLHVPPMPWVGQPLPAATLKACVDGLWAAAAAATEVPGWSAKTLGTCSDGATVRFDIVPQGGTVNWVKPFISRVPGAPELTDFSAHGATLVWKLPSLSSYEFGAPGIQLDKARDYLSSHFAEFQMPVQIGGDITGQSFWKSFRYNFSTSLDPNLFTPLLSKIPGSVIREVTLNTSSGQWTITGEVFQRLQPIGAPPLVK